MSLILYIQVFINPGIFSILSPPLFHNKVILVWSKNSDRMSLPFHSRLRVPSNLWINLLCRSLFGLVELLLLANALVKLIDLGLQALLPLTHLHLHLLHLLLHGRDGVTHRHVGELHLPVESEQLLLSLVLADMPSLFLRSLRCIWRMSWWVHNTCSLLMILF